VRGNRRGGKSSDEHSHSLRNFADEAKPHTRNRSKIAGDQIVRAPGTANVHLGCGGAYQVPVEIEHVEKTRLIVTGIGLNSLQRTFIDEKRCLDSAIVSPESYGTPRAVV